MELPYDINLVGWGETDSGDVVTKDGEYLGRWEADENDHAAFFPDGEPEKKIFNPFLGLLISDIRQWKLKRDGKAER